MSKKKDRIWMVLLLIWSLIIGLMPLGVFADETKEEFVNDELIVEISHEFSDQSVVYELADEYGCEVIKVLAWNDNFKDAVLLIKDGSSVENKIKEIEADSRVEYAQPNYTYSLEEEDPLETPEKTEDTGTEISAPLPGPELNDDHNSGEYVDNEILVTPRTGADINDIAADYSCKVTRELKGTFLLTILSGEDPWDLKERMGEDPRVEYANVNYYYYPQEIKTEAGTGTENAKTGKEKAYSGNSVDWSKLVPDKDYYEGELLVVFDDSLDDQAKVTEIANECGCEADRIIAWNDREFGKIAHMVITDGSTVSEAIAKFEAYDLVQYAQINVVYELSQTVNDEYVSDQWHLDKTGLFDAWDITHTDGEVTVAVFDTGVQLDHEDLYANINTDLAWDVVTDSALTGDEHGHGTHVAGIISAVTNNGIGVSGVSYNARILPVNIANHVNYRSSSAYMIAAYDHILNNYLWANIKVINISFTGSNNFDNTLAQRIQTANTVGIVSVCSAGNTGDGYTETYPSDYDACISVTATDSNDVIADFSTGGHHKDISAPGVNILSTYPDNSYEYLSGTSMAAPVVSGVLALMFTANEGLSVDQAKYILYATADEHTIPSSLSGNYYGVGRVNARYAVNRAAYGSWKRVSGSNRYNTMKAISQEAWKAGSCPTVIVATGEDFPDALTGSALAGIYDCPLILTKCDYLSAQAQSEIIRLGAQNVIILGSTAAVSTATENSIKAIVGSSHVTRVQGTNRYGTSYEIYQAGAGQWSNTLILATGATAPDALAISSYAYASKSPIFLVKNADTLTASMRTAISSGAFQKVVIVGAPEVVSSDIENWVKTQVGTSNVTRLYGSNRYKTSSKVSEWATGNLTSAAVQPEVVLTYHHPGIANGGDEHFADALSGGAMCGHNRSVLMLSKDITTTSNTIVQNNVIPHRAEIKLGYVFGADIVLSENFRYHLIDMTIL